MIDAFDKDQPALPRCRGRRPHLRDLEPGCHSPLRAILLGASNSWFPETGTVLSVPTRGDKLGQLIEEAWAILDKATSLDVLRAFRRVGQRSELAECVDDEI